jgi:hypothetical protein
MGNWEESHKDKVPFIISYHIISHHIKDRTFHPSSCLIAVYIRPAHEAEVTFVKFLQHRQNRDFLTHP